MTQMDVAAALRLWADDERLDAGMRGVALAALTAIKELSDRRRPHPTDALVAAAPQMYAALKRLTTLDLVLDAGLVCDIGDALNKAEGDT